eukprot:GEMP01059304.1.p1 GENE.GEMP01059304.1~~GEMP01059304.1.p1  ORF type:complete len:134 (-),score=23.89 GEMP01059304.1:872-1273(-)
MVVENRRRPAQLQSLDSIDSSHCYDSAKAEPKQAAPNCKAPPVPAWLKIGWCPIKHTFIDFPSTPVGHPQPPMTTPASFAPQIGLHLTKPQTIRLSDLVSSPKKMGTMPYGIAQKMQAPGPAAPPEDAYYSVY